MNMQLKIGKLFNQLAKAEARYFANLQKYGSRGQQTKKAKAAGDKIAKAIERIAS